VEVLGYGIPVGLGSHVHWDRKIDAALAQAVMSIQAVKGVEIGDGFEGAGRRGSAAHDAIVWDDDPGSALYNEWVDTASQSAGVDPEPMYNTPAYSHGAVIAYNSARTPGLGSAIFLHVSTGGATAGCVSLPASQLLAVLRWLDPSQQPRIVMGTAAGVTS
jgi:hypothetical protein